MNVIIQDTIKMNELLLNNEEPPFGPGPSIDEHSIFSNYIVIFIFYKKFIALAFESLINHT